MKHTWEFSDGTNVQWTSDGTFFLESNTELTKDIQTALEVHEFEPWGVRVHPPPGGTVDLDVSNIWIVDRFLELEAMRLGISVVASTYTRTDEHMPPEVSTLVHEARNWKYEGSLGPGEYY